MDKNKRAGVLVIDGVRDLDLKQTLDCGQCFRWEEKESGIFTGMVNGGKAQVKLEGGRLFIACASFGADQEQARAYWETYFDLRLDYGKIKSAFAQMHPVLKAAAKYAPGIRVLNQDPWEALCSFILSQNNNIPRIKGIIRRLCENFGERREDGYTFPGAQRLSACTAEELEIIKSGFRAKYVMDAAQKVASGAIDLQAVGAMELAQARQTLLQIKGVGPKVAECVLLYGMHRLDCFPMDVWMKRAMDVLFPGIKPSAFGAYAGIAQQYIFHYSRMHPKLFA